MQGSTHGVPIDTDGGLTANSDFLVPSEKAVKTYISNSIVSAVTGSLLATGKAISGLYVKPDSNISFGSSYERVNYAPGTTGFIQLAPQRTWTQTIADSKTNVPAGWTWSNSASILNSDVNTTTAGALFINHVTGTSTAFNGTTQTAPFLWKTVAPGNRHTFICRIKRGTIDTVNKYAVMTVLNTTTGTLLASVGFDGTPELLFANGAAQTAVGTTGAVLDAGVWFRIDIIAGDCIMYYNTANQSTPPTSWTIGRESDVGYFKSGDSYKVGFAQMHATTSTASSASYMYFDDRGDDATYADAPNPLYATGFDNSGPAQTLIASFDLGDQNATISNTLLQNALTEASNQRAFDTAAWTFSAVRGASSNPAAGSYQAPASVTVAGTGQFFALYAKCTSTGRVQAGSINPTAINVPIGNILTQTFTAASGLFTAGSILYAGSTGVISQDNANLFYDVNNQFLGVGINTPASIFHGYSVGSTRLTLDSLAGAGGAATVLLRTGRTSGTGATATNDWLGLVSFRGAYAGPTLSSSTTARITAIAAENFTSIAQGSHLALETTPTGSTTLAERVRITSQGLIGIGITGPIWAIDFGNTQANANIIIGTLTNGTTWTGIGMSSTDAGLRIAGDPNGATLSLMDVGYYATAGHAWNSKFLILENGTTTLNGAITATSFTGAGTGLTGTAASLTAGVATTTAITDDTTTAATMYPVWVTTASGNQAHKTSSSKITWNPSTGTLSLSVLNIVGFWGSPDGVATLVNGANANVVPGGSFMHTTGPTANFTISGFTGGTDGRELLIWNNVGFTMGFTYDDAGSSAGNRIRMRELGAVTCTGTFFSWAHFKYSGADSHWIMVGHS